jgi:DNA-binding NtrC family response regulator
MPFKRLKFMKTLLIDDDEFVRDSLRLLFLSKGCPLLTLETAEEAIEAIRAEDYDVVITDYRLPGMDGLELCRQIAEMSPHAKKILITAYGSKAVADEAKTVGVLELIEKPITSGSIEDSLRRLFSGAA